MPSSVVGDRASQVARIAKIVPISTTVRACRDPNDDKILELGVSGEAAPIVTGDRDLLALTPFRTVGIVAPAQFLALPDAALATGAPGAPGDP